MTALAKARAHETGLVVLRDVVQSGEAARSLSLTNAAGKPSASASLRIVCRDAVELFKTAGDN